MQDTQTKERPTRLLIIGGVAGGATAAARARRLDERAEITVIERGPYVSYANCGLPYFLSGDIQKRSQLLLQTPEGFDARYGVKVRLQTEAVELDVAHRRVRVRSTEGEEWLDYDRLILAQGGTPLMPPVTGADAPHVFRLWTVPDMDRIQQWIEQNGPRSAVIVGGGFVGLEMAEAFTRRGLATTVVEQLPTVMSIMDAEFGRMVEAALTASAVRVLASTSVRAVHAGTREVELSDGSRIPGELVLFATGVRPELALARNAGLVIGETGGVLVDEHLRTSDPNVFAAGDMTEIVHRIAGRKVRMPLAGPANRQGRIAATNALGGHMRYGGAVGTSIVKVFDTTVAVTGLTEETARRAGFHVGAAMLFKDHHAGYYPGAKEMALKLVYDRASSRLLGAQAFGADGVDKRIDVLATALQGRLTLDDLAELDLAYAPPFSSANDPVNVAAFIAQNDVSGFSPVVTARQLKTELAGDNPPLVLDVRHLAEHERSHVKGAMHIPLDDLRFELAALPRGRRIAVHCRSGFRAHLALRILKANGFADVVNVTGGYLAIQAEGGFKLEES